MPTHVYIPSRNPPRWYDRLLVHPFDNAIGVLCILFGALMVAALASGGGYNPSSSMMRLPVYIGFIVSSCIALGGILSLVGLHWIGETVSRGWHIERFGWLFVTAGLAGYAIAVAWHFPSSTTSWMIPGVLAAAAMLRFVSLILIERNTRTTLAAVREETRGHA
ncbi:hypothetical protein LJR013_003186 [Pseudarthrobacter oxydans]|uniref:hypothetical protein n=1 Tax=Pseudarthrobacter oxydans TaxID=1671 RepID=UPI003ED049CB